jgi:hypothetical protein
MDNALEIEKEEPNQWIPLSHRAIFLVPCLFAANKM